MKRIGILVVVLFVLACISVGYAQQPSPLQPTEVQKLTLENLQLKAKLAQAAYASAQNEFQNTLRALNEAGTKAIKDNKWPEGTLFDPNALTFTKPAEPAPKAAEVKK